MYALFPELAERRRQLASRLSGGQQQILAVAQGIIAEPRLLILDEPSGGLAPLVIDRILDVASALHATAWRSCLVEQLVEKALAHADRCYLMATGRSCMKAWRRNSPVATSCTARISAAAHKRCHSNTSMQPWSRSGNRPASSCAASSRRMNSRMGPSVDVPWHPETHGPASTSLVVRHRRLERKSGRRCAGVPSRRKSKPRSACLTR